MSPHLSARGQPAGVSRRCHERAWEVGGAARERSNVDRSPGQPQLQPAVRRAWDAPSLPLRSCRAGGVPQRGRGGDGSLWWPGLLHRAPTLPTLKTWSKGSVSALRAPSRSGSAPVEAGCSVASGASEPIFVSTSCEAALVAGGAASISAKALGRWACAQQLPPGAAVRPETWQAPRG